MKSEPKRYTNIMLLILAGVVLNILGQGIFSHAVNRELECYKHLLGAVNVKNKIENLKSDVLLIESRVRGYVITESPSFAQDIDFEFEKAYKDVKQIRNDTKDKPQFAKVIDSVNHFIELKIQFQRQILELYKRNGKVQAEQLIASGTGKALRENILVGINTLDEFAIAEITRIEKELDGQRKIASLFDTFLPYASTAIFCVLGFLLLRNVSRHEKLIEHSNKVAQQEKAAYMVKDQFISNISHEVRTPLNSVIGYSGLLQKTELSETQQKFVNAIQTSGENLLYIINELLDFGKIEEGLMVVHKEPFSFPDLIDQVALMFQDGFRKKNIQFSVNVDPSLKNMLGDNAKVRQVLVNLINNALKFTERGKVEVIVQQISVAHHQCNVRIIVRDSGIGIAQEHQSRIFERFYQVQGATDRKYGGTGLGLSIIHQLIDLMGGKISVVSELNKGTQFTIDLPFDMPEKIEQEAYSITIKVPRDAKKKILVVDDNALNRDLTMHVLNSWNYEVRTVDNGIMALERLKTEKFDLVLMDVQMPGMDGYTVTQKIREELGNPIPVIALTAHSNKSERDKCIEAGMNEYVSKPFKELELFGIITKLLAQTGPSHMKLAYLKSLSKGNIEFEQRILKRFQEETPIQLANLKSDISKMDREGIRKIVHDMKANVGIVGLDKDLEFEFRKVTNLGNDVDKFEAFESFEIIQKHLTLCIEEIDRLYF